jgi:hypothetical protein
MSPIRPLLLAPAALLLLPAAPSVASTIGVQGTTLTVTAATGERNRFTVATSGATIRVFDGGSRPTAGPGCTRSGRTVTCPATRLTELVADLGDRDDRMEVRREVRLRTRLRGGRATTSWSAAAGPTSSTAARAATPSPTRRGATR